MQTVHIEFISDFICPWCYIGKARLARVQAALEPEINLEIHVKPYILYPFIPKGGLPKAEFAKKTKPGMGKSLRHEADLEGIQLNYRQIERIPSSMEAHRLVALVQDTSKQYALAKQLFVGYFEEGKNIEDHAYLTEQAEAWGIEQATIDAFASPNQGIAKVEADLQAIKEEFVRVVPTLRLDHRLLLPGLQTDKVWETYIRRAAKLQTKGES